MSLVWQTVRVFISSTFRDMHAERDYLVKFVFPALREKLEKYHVHLIDVDLRWGITEEQAENDQWIAHLIDDTYTQPHATEMADIDVIKPSLSE